MHTSPQRSNRVCICFMCLCLCVPPHPQPSLNLNPSGWGCKGDVWNLVVSVYLLCLSLLSERNKSHVGDAAWGLRVHPSSSSSPLTPISFLHLRRIPLRRGKALLMFNHAGVPDANEPETNTERSNLDSQWEMSLPTACPGHQCLLTQDEKK